MERGVLRQYSVAIVAVWLGAVAAQAQPPAPNATTAAGQSTTTEFGNGIEGIWNARGGASHAGRRAARASPVLAVDSKPPPLRAEAKALIAARNKLATSGKTATRDRGACVPPGMPNFMDPVRGARIQIIETPEQHQISVLSESYRTFRIIHMNGAHPADPDPTFQGHSVGHWEGDTLVVDTIGLQATTDVFNLGIAHSEDMHLVERIRRVGADRLENVMTIEDPKVFSRPFVVKITLQRAKRTWLEERICEL